MRREALTIRVEVKDLPLLDSVGVQAAVIRLAVAWAGSKPLVSIVDGTMAGLIGIRFTGILLAPARNDSGRSPRLVPTGGQAACVSQYSRTS